MESKISWSKESIQQIVSAIEYIRQDSDKNADSIYDKIILRLIKVANNPGMCPPDRYKRRNNGKFRAFTIFRYRVSYRIEDEGIRILRIRHSSMKAKYY
jgi:plasmid stabilization system protein ParE